MEADVWREHQNCLVRTSLSFNDIDVVGVDALFDALQTHPSMTTFKYGPRALDRLVAVPSRSPTTAVLVECQLVSVMMNAISRGQAMLRGPGRAGREDEEGADAQVEPVADAVRQVNSDDSDDSDDSGEERSGSSNASDDGGSDGDESDGDDDDDYLSRWCEAVVQCPTLRHVM